MNYLNRKYMNMYYFHIVVLGFLFCIACDCYVEVFLCVEEEVE